MEVTGVHPFVGQSGRPGQLLRSSGVEPVWVIKYFRTAMNAANRVVERGNYRPVSNRCYQLQLGGNIFANFARVFFEEKKLGFRARVKRCRFTV